MDPTVGVLIAESMKMGIAVFLAYQRANGKTEEETAAMFNVELEKAMKFDPNSIKDV